MAQTGDKKKKFSWTYIGGFVILAIILVSFIIGPVLGSQLGRSRIVFGQYIRRDVEYVPGNWFARTYELIAQDVRQRDSANEELESQLRVIWRQAFDRAMLHTAILVDSERLEMGISEQYIDRIVAQSPSFQNNGRFDVEVYRSVPAQERRAFREYLAESHLHDQYLDDRLYGLQSSRQEQEFLATMGDVERQVRFAVLDFSQFPEAEVVNFLEENEPLFHQFEVSVISIVESRRTAENIRERVVNLEASFEDMAREVSVDSYADSGGARGTAYYYELDRTGTELFDILTALEVNDISEVVETHDGWAFYRLESPAVKPDPADSQQLTDIRTYMEIFERGLVEDYLVAIAEAWRARAAVGGLAAAAQEFDVPLHVTNYFPINYGNIELFALPESNSTNLLDGIQSRVSFFELVFGLEPGEISEPLAIRDNVVIFELLDERQGISQDYIEDIEFFYPVMVEDFQLQDLESTLLRRDLIIDNFEYAFATYVLGGQ